MISSVYKGKPLISVRVEIYPDVLRDNGWLAQKRHFVPDENEEDMSFTFR
ncbi:phosphatidylinositol kinase [Neisseria meningitidis]|uniref:Phosphatidylinositol kinase n=1 Tax=Neisseria meningitidis TaxID=487 RepID=A0A422SU32_NEIME|nr:phosphatidylinositol kinase [Neisseria meningitidis]MBG8633342.1 phosphatidylinositol kinase [Neisseria meningitidis]MBG8659881.1 phosphatidylinositol kinase [Neisseria meningitidis]MBG8744952.1 phosphatidylinositol kinase [Neisseria meningitidis]MBG8767682.1 phosphatidylinositol kinase [Neisseria meningitidis]